MTASVPSTTVCVPVGPSEPPLRPRFKPAIMAMDRVCMYGWMYSTYTSCMLEYLAQLHMECIKQYTTIRRVTDVHMGAIRQTSIMVRAGAVPKFCPLLFLGRRHGSWCFVAAATCESLGNMVLLLSLSSSSSRSIHHSPSSPFCRWRFLHGR